MGEQKPIIVSDPSQKIKIGLMMLALVLGATYLMFSFSEKQIFGALSVSNRAVNSSSTVVAAAAEVLALNSARERLECWNIGNADIWLSSTSTGLVAGAGGALLKGSSSIVMKGDDLWPGALYGRTKVDTTSTLACWEI